MYISFMLATPVQFWIGWRFYRGAYAALKHGTADMNVLIAVGTSAAYFYSVVATFLPTLVMVGGQMPQHVLRYVHDDHRADPAGQAAGGPGQRADVRGDTQAARA